MALFCFYRGGLEESLKTTVVVKNKEELINHLKLMETVIPGHYLFDETEITPHLFDKSFDERTGWYAQIVKIKAKDNIFYPIGFLSEPL